jgi:hypothetical protein
MLHQFLVNSSPKSAFKIPSIPKFSNGVVLFTNGLPKTSLFFHHPLSTDTLFLLPWLPTSHPSKRVIGLGQGKQIY